MPSSTPRIVSFAAKRQSHYNFINFQLIRFIYDSSYPSSMLNQSNSADYLFAIFSWVNSFVFAWGSLHCTAQSHCMSLVRWPMSFVWTFPIEGRCGRLGFPNLKILNNKFLFFRSLIRLISSDFFSINGSRNVMRLL